MGIMSTTLMMPMMMIMQDDGYKGWSKSFETLRKHNLHASGCHFSAQCLLGTRSGSFSRRNTELQNELLLISNKLCLEKWQPEARRLCFRSVQKLLDHPLGQKIAPYIGQGTRQWIRQEIDTTVETAANTVIRGGPKVLKHLANITSTHRAAISEAMFVWDKK